MIRCFVDVIDSGRFEKRMVSLVSSLDVINGTWMEFNLNITNQIGLYTFPESIWLTINVVICGYCPLGTWPRRMGILFTGIDSLALLLWSGSGAVAIP